MMSLLHSAFQAALSFAYYTPYTSAGDLAAFCLLKQDPSCWYYYDENDQLEPFIDNLAGPRNYYPRLHQSGKLNLRYDPTIKPEKLSSMKLCVRMTQDTSPMASLCSISALILRRVVLHEFGRSIRRVTIKKTSSFSRIRGCSWTQCLREISRAICLLRKKDHYFLAVASDGPVHLDADLVDQTLGTIMRDTPATNRSSEGVVMKISSQM
jgi:hypothetical protein